MQLQTSSLNPPSSDFLDYREIKAFAESITGKKFYSKSHIWNLMRSGDFPKAVKVSAQTTWRKADVVVWLRERGIFSNADMAE